jgi:hypothetical protein
MLLDMNRMKEAESCFITALVRSFPTMRRLSKIYAETKQAQKAVDYSKVPPPLPAPPRPPLFTPISPVPHAAMR